MKLPPPYKKPTTQYTTKITIKNKNNNNKSTNILTLDQAVVLVSPPLL